MTRHRTLSIVTFALLVGVAAAASLTSAADKAVLRLRAFAVNMSGTGGPPTGATLEIVIERWSTDAETGSSPSRPWALAKARVVSLTAACDPTRQCETSSARAPA